MKNTNRIIRTGLLLAIIFLMHHTALAQLQVPFAPRFSDGVYGDFLTIGNNMLSTTATGNYTGTDGNHNLTTVFVDIDADATTFNSSSANLTGPIAGTNCVAIKKAYLYWAAADLEESNPANEPVWNYNEVKLMLPGAASYTTISADNTIFRGRATHFVNDPYVCFKDITALVQGLGSPYGKYQLANVRAKKGTLNPDHTGGNVGTSGGWQIIFIYEGTETDPQGNSVLPAKHISIFDGYGNVTSSQNNYNITISGFQTPPVGSIQTKIMFGSLEGDRDLSGDRFQIRNVANTFVDLTTGTNRPTTNFFNSRITVGNSDFTDRNPASTNTLGYDIGYFTLNNPSNTIITNSQTSAVFRLTSNQETYGLYMIGFSTDVWAPDLSPLLQVSSPGTTNPGDTISYTFTVKNNGNDDAKNVVITRTIPPEVELVQPVTPLPVGVTYSYNAGTRVLTFTIQNGLVDITDPAINISYKTVVKDQCYFLETACVPSTSAQLLATYIGTQNPATQTTLSSNGLTGCGLGNDKSNTTLINQPSVATWATLAGVLDRTVNCNDTQALAAAQALSPVTNKCNFTLNKVSGTLIPNTCPIKGIYTNTWTFTDKCGRTSPVFTQTITVQDTTKPVFTGQLPANITVNCDAVPTAPTLTATDNCGQATVTFDESRTNGNCANNYILTRTWTSSDVCNNRTIHVQTITVQDTTKPTFTGQLPTNITVNCDAVPTAPTLTATDNCGQATVTFDESRTNGNCANNYILTRTWTASDACNNRTIHVQAITVQDTTKPTFTGQLPSNITVNCDAVPTAPTLTATDNCGQAIVTFDESRTNGNCANNYILTRTWTATDACNNRTIHVQTITVQDTTKPIFTGQLPANITVNCDAVPTAPTLTATDNCGQATVTFDESRTNGNCANNYVLTRTWTASDVCNNQTIHVQVITVQDTTKPVFTGQLPSNITVNCDAVPTAPTLSATDNCGQATVTFDESRTNGNCTNNYVLTRTWTASDVCNNRTIHVQTITVQDTTKPIFTGQLPANITVNCDAVPTAPTLTATDNCGQATVTFDESRTNGNCANNYVLTRTWTASDVCNNQTIHVQVITVQDTTKPVFTGQLPSNITVNCDAVPTAPTLSATDNCGQATVTFDESRTNGNCTNNYVLTRTWTASDVCNNRTIHVQTITVQDTTKPIFTGQLPANITVNCDAVPTAPTLTATDNCGQATVTFDESRTNGNCANNYVLTRTWTSSDVCNNRTIHVQTITVQDTTKPTFVGQLPANITVNCDAVPSAPTLSATDNCGQATVTFDESRTNGNCTNNYVLTRTWTASDVCNNRTIHVQTITVQDTTKPIFTGQLPANITVNCDAVPTAPTLTATDNCGQATVTFDESRTNGNCANNYVLTRTWTATDACNNRTIHVQTITVQDTTKPIFTGQLPANITVNCDAVPTAPTLTATDNCGQATVTFDESRTNGNCANSYVLTRTWTASDVCNNRTIHVQTITVQDTTKPTFTGQLPANITVNCDAVPTAPTLTATDNCGQATVTFDETTTPGGCIGNGGITRTWTATDACNNRTIHVQTITVQDTTKPVFTGQLPANITVNCDAVPTAPTLTATDNCGQATVTFDESRTNGNCANSYVLTRTWTASDVCNNRTIHVQTITVQDTTKPTFTGQLPSNITVNCDAVPTAPTLSATDNCGQATVTFDESRTNGNCANSYVLTRTWTASDVCNNRTIHVQTITVQDTTKPTFTGQLPANITVNCDAVPTAPTLAATDNCGQATVTFDESRTNGNCANSYVLTRTWTASDVCNNQTINVQTITVQDTTKPTFTGQLPVNITVNCDAVPTAPTLSATDNCGQATVTFDESRANGNCANNYILTRTWTASDVCNNRTIHIQIITVQDTTKPTFTGQLPSNITVNCDAVPIAPTLTATDNCGQATVTFDETTTPGGCIGNGGITRTWTATDACNNRTIHVQTITVQDTTKPVFTGQLPSNITVNCDAVPTAPTLSATDNCGQATVTFDESRTNGNCANSYILTRTWTASDACNNRTIHVQTITVQDTTKPVFTGQLPANITVNCDAVPTAPTLTATDNCGQATVTFDENRTNGNCTNNYVLTRTWTASDVCNNRTIHVQTITVQDTTKPTFTGQLPSNITVNCDAVPTAPTLTATDNCGQATVTFDESRTNGNCANNYVLTRTWTASDVCNNRTIHVQTITVQDTTKPTFTGQLPVNITVNCDAVPTAPTLSATDNCGQATVTFDENRTNGNCANNYILTRTWTASDVCNNRTIHVQTITVQDTTKPTFTGQLPANITVNCDAVPTAPTLTATDNCGQATVTFDESRTNGNCANNYILTRTWTASDVCNNRTIHVQTITVQDTTKPTFTGQLPANITVNCDAVPTAPTLTATDNCGQATVTFDESRTNGNCANNYILTRTWTASDVCNNRTIHVQTITVQDTTKPTFTGQLPTNITVNCDAVPTAPTLTATDNCGQATVTFDETTTPGGCIGNGGITRTWTATDACNNRTIHVQTITVQDTTKPTFTGQLPANITVNCDAVPIAPTLTATDNCGQATVTFDESRTNGNCANNYILTRTWTASDVCNNRTIYVQTITVQDTTKPTFTGQLPANITVNCDAVPIAPTLTATDNCGQATVTFDESRTNGNCANNYILTRTWTASDVCNNRTIHVQTITVQDTTKPTFTGQLPSNITVNCDAVPTAPTLTATDNCGQATVTFDENRTNGNCANNYILTRTWTASDVCNNRTIHVQTITVQDTTKPTFTGQLPANITVNCDAVPTAPTLTATDNCGQATLTFDESRTNGNCANSYVLTRTWTASDVCNNRTIHVQTITVQDTTKPVFTGQLPSNEIVCSIAPEPVILTAADNCGLATVVFIESIDSVSTPNIKVYTRIWTATDVCSNSTVHEQIITVNPDSKSTIDTAVFDCQGGITVGGQVFIEPGTYQIILQNSYSCDSVVTLNLRVRICDTIPIGQDTTIYDTLPVLTSTEICNLSLPPGNNVQVLSCNGDTIGTTVHGTWTINNQTKCLEFTAGSITGNDTLCISACDTITRQCNTTTIIITVSGLPPIAEDDCVEETEKNKELIINVLENDSDPDNDQLILQSIIVQPKHGEATIDQRNQNIIYTPNNNYCGRDTLYYVVCDGDDGCDTAMVCINVICECILPQVITPNNDGFNDNLVFPCITGIDGVKLLVWHRWGLIIYEDNNYKNDWQGTLKGELLPAGTYWYSIEYKNPETQQEVKEVNYFMIIN